MNILDQFSSSGKWAFVTERKRRMGKAIVLALAEAGADIIGFSYTLELNGC